MNGTQKVLYSGCLKVDQTIHGIYPITRQDAENSMIRYSRSPGTTNSAAIDAIFNANSITNEAGQTDYPIGKGPQGDAIRIYNYVRLVRDLK